MYKEFDEYKVSLDNSDIDILDSRIKQNGVDQVIESQLHFLDCTRTINTSSGVPIRAIQTIDYSYKDELSKLLYVVDKYVDNKVEIYAKILEQHINNIEYEKQNPPIVYKKKKKTNKKVGIKTTTNPVERISAKKLKEVNKLKKLSLLKFKIK